MDDQEVICYHYEHHMALSLQFFCTKILLPSAECENEFNLYAELQLFILYFILMIKRKEKIMQKIRCLHGFIENTILP